MQLNKKPGNKSKKSPCDTNIIAYRKLNAKFRKAVKAQKTICLEEFTSTISPGSSSKKIWAYLRTFTGNYVSRSIHTIKDQTKTITSPPEIAEHFAKTWEHFGDDSNFHRKFVKVNKIFSSTSHQQPLSIPPPSSLKAQYA